MNKLRNVSLEMSLKPFRSVTDDAIDAVICEAFRQWSPLLKDAEQVSVLLWTADGSEILTYTGDLDAPIEWGRYIGGANPKWNVPGDSEGKSLHSRGYLYCEDPATITYRDLKRIVASIRRIGSQMLGLPIRVGETFDPGCEFAKSPFKYELHNEICLADTGGPKSFACCYATLNGDTARYAGFPEGIPEETPLGTFLGRQARHLLSDIGFDYLWLSNGFGFGLETWMTKGPMFNGAAFDASQANEIREKILNFWRYFRKECPQHRIETRGTNLSTGIDLASDAVPLREIYDGDFNMEPPPNSPWAALNSDFGLELAGWMSHIAELPPGGHYPFRFYAHDPWWHNSPWLDRYGRQPHDILLPMSVSRLDESGAACTPDSILFLTIDDSYGRLPEQVPNEVIPFIQDCRHTAPDQPGPLVWVYPFDEYHAMTFGNSPRIDEPFFGDWFIRSAIRNGLPLNTVVSSGNFAKHLRDGWAATYRGSILVAPVPDGGSALHKSLLQFVDGGGAVLLYGPLRHAGADLLARLGLSLDGEIAGDLNVRLQKSVDQLATPYPSKIHHRTLMNAGGYEAISTGQGKVLATVASGEQERVAAVVAGKIAWVRGTSSSGYVGGDLISGAGHLPRSDDPGEWFEGDLLMRFALAEFGTSISIAKRSSLQPNPITTIHRHDNAFYFSGFVPDMTAELRFLMPQGAPIFVGCDAELKDGHACYRMPRAWRHECRVFVEQSGGVVSCIEKTAEMIGLKRRLRVTGLENATVRIFPQRNDRPVSIVANGSYPYFEGPFPPVCRCDDARGRYLQVAGICGELVIGW